MNGNNKLPDNFDWVRERAACSVAAVFRRLQSEVEQDIQAVNAVLGLDENQFCVSANASRDSFVVSREEHTGGEVRFWRGSNEIQIKRNDRPDLVVTVTLKDDGQCRLKMSTGEEVEPWQLRRMALEELFFAEPATPPPSVESDHE